MAHRSRSMLVVLVGLLAAASPHAQSRVRAPIVNAGERHPAPAFELRDATGKVISLAGFKGTPVVVNLWATECEGCKLELPSFVALHQQFPREVAVIGVSMDVGYDGLKDMSEGWARVTPFAAAHHLGYTIVMDDGSVEKAYSVTAMPATYLIDRRGQIAATYVGVVDAADLDANVRQLISEHQ